MRILIADDNVVFRTILADELQSWGYETALAKDGEEALELLSAEDGPRLAILDWVMPGIDGVEVCRRVRALNGPYRYLILLTGKREASDVVEALNSGADDFLSKPFNSLELRARLGAGLRVVMLQEELMTAQQALRELAVRDPLTGLLNRRGMDEAVKREFSRAERDGTPVGVILVDIDHFKQVNDKHYHSGGDHVLRSMARRLESHLRTADVLGRLGGEEFLMLLPGCGVDESLQAAERLCSAIGDEEFEVPTGEFVRVTGSFGVASSEQLPKSRPEGIIDAADRALYLAKCSGRNRVELFREGIRRPEFQHA